MTDYSQTPSGRGDAWRRGFAVAAILLLLAALESARAGDSIWTETYAGLFAGSGLAQNRLVDVDGFANWGYPGSLSEYDDQGFAWGALAGSRFEFAGTPLRFEVDATFGDLSASTDRLDPEGRDETAIADYQWLATARAGVEDRLGGVTLFATGGLAAARIDNSVTDIDFIFRHAAANGPRRFLSGQLHAFWMGHRSRGRDVLARFLDPSPRGLLPRLRTKHLPRESFGRQPLLRNRNSSKTRPVPRGEQHRSSAPGTHPHLRPVAPMRRAPAPRAVAKARRP